MSLRPFGIAFAVLVCGVAIGKSDPPATTVVTTAPQGFSAKAVLGSKVNITGGTGIGTVDDIMINSDGAVEYLAVLHDGKYVVVPWQAAKFNHEQRTAVVTISQDAYRKIPTYTVQQWPTVRFYDPTYRIQTYKYYGLTPGQERRIERDIKRQDR